MMAARAQGQSVWEVIIPWIDRASGLQDEESSADEWQ